MIKHLNTIDSTQKEARRFVESPDSSQLGKLRSGIAWLAKEQQSGEGQYKNSWISEAGGLYYSLLIENHNKTSNFWPNTIANVVESVIEESVQITLTPVPPNDLYINDKKAGGIIIEHHRIQDTPVSIIGIGLNINQPLMAVDIYSTSTSLKIESGHSYDITSIAEDLHTALVDCVQSLNTY